MESDPPKSPEGRNECKYHIHSGVEEQSVQVRQVWSCKERPRLHAEEADCPSIRPTSDD